MQACKRLNTRRSKIASDVLKEVKKFFKESEFVNKPEKIKDWAHWALHYDGPGFYHVTQFLETMLTMSYVPHL
jgi:hypothetical protein